MPDTSTRLCTSSKIVNHCFSTQNAILRQHQGFHKVFPELSSINKRVLGHFKNIPGGLVTNQSGQANVPNINKQNSVICAEHGQLPDGTMPVLFDSLNNVYWTEMSARDRHYQIRPKLTRITDTAIDLRYFNVRRASTIQLHFSIQ